MSIFSKPVNLKYSDAFGGTFTSKEFANMRKEYVETHPDVADAGYQFLIKFDPTLVTEEDARESLTPEDFNALVAKMAEANVSFKPSDWWEVEAAEIAAKIAESKNKKKKKKAAKSNDSVSQDVTENGAAEDEIVLIGNTDISSSEVVEPKATEVEAVCATTEETTEAPVDEVVEEVSTLADKLEVVDDSATTEEQVIETKVSSAPEHPEQLANKQLSEIVNNILSVGIPSKDFDSEMVNILITYCENHPGCQIEVNDKTDNDGNSMMQYCLFDPNAEENKKQIALLTLTNGDDEMKDVRTAVWHFIGIDLNVGKCNKSKLVLQRLGIQGEYKFTDEGGMKYYLIQNSKYTNIYVGTSVSSAGTKYVKKYTGMAEIDIINLPCKIPENEYETIGTVEAEDIELHEEVVDDVVEVVNVQDLDIDGNEVIDDDDFEVLDELPSDVLPESKKSKKKRVLKKVGIIAGIVVIVGGVGFAIYKLLTK